MRSISTCMRKALAPDYPQSSLQDDASFASLFWSIDKRSRSDDKRFPRRTNSTSQQIMSRWQEEYFLDFFWQSYHCIYPIVDEGEFKAHHNSIWIMPYEPRKPSALVDIILAVTMQYGTALLPPDITKPALNAGEKRKDAASAGRSYFRRCQALLVDDLENPSITSLQCHILSVIYLSNAGSHNTAHSSLALACRVAVILGLHREPLGELDQDKRNFHRRLWWTLYALEIKAAMGLGRPLAINFSEVTCCLPTDAPNAGSITTPGSAKMPELASCFTTNSQFSKLILAARSAYVTFYQKCADVLGLGQQNTFHGNPEALEVCARFLSSKMEYLNTWLCEAPDSLKMKRRGGESFSTDGSPLHVQPIVPLYQQRQQVFLELHYHTVAMNLLRHFINFSHPLSSSTPQAEANAIACVDHAITITKIIHQMLTGTDLLGGWLESFYWHGNAFLSLVGYTLAYPDGERTAEARRAIVLAISTFDIISSSLGIAVSSAKMARELAAKVDLIVERGRAGSLPPSSSESNTCHLMRDSNNNSMNSGTAVAVQDPNLQDPFVSDDIDMLGSDEWSSEMPRHSVDFTSGSSWINPEGSLNLDAWGFGYDYNVDPYNLWVDPHGESCVGEEN
jgi:hypothetical protein